MNMIQGCYDYLCAETRNTVRYFFDIAYKGIAYHGWQSQKNAIGVQQVISEKLLQITGEQSEITGSGRTDAGVHALQQIFHVDLMKNIQPEKLRYRLNAILPKDIFVRKILPVRPDAHARFDAVLRTYEYRISTEKDPFRLNEAYFYYKKIRIDLLNDAASQLLGRHDFQAFSKVKTDVNNYFCTITQAKWQQDGPVYHFYISADRFLRGMVRAIVGTLLLVNEEKLSLEQLGEILESRNRQKAGRSVPPEGLFLIKVNYPEDIFIQ